MKRDYNGDNKTAGISYSFIKVENDKNRVGIFYVELRYRILIKKIRKNA